MREQAQALAARRYSVKIERDETTDGQPVWLLSHPELPGCMAQGISIEEALENLDDARFEYILSLLEDGLPVPAPTGRVATTASLAIGDSRIITISGSDTLSPPPSTGREEQPPRRAPRFQLMRVRTG